MKNFRQTREAVTFRPRSTIGQRLPKRGVAPQLATVAVISRGRNRRADETRPKTAR